MPEPLSVVDLWAVSICMSTSWLITHGKELAEELNSLSVRLHKDEGYRNIADQLIISQGTVAAVIKRYPSGKSVSIISV